MKVFSSKSAITKIQAGILIIIIIVAAAAVYYGLYYNPSPTEPSEKRILRINFSLSPTIDPAVGSDLGASSTFPHLYDSLVYPTITGDVEPHLAQSWVVSDDALTWTFNLREGAKFQDGSELTAGDVKFSMDRLLAIGEGYSYLFAPYIDNTTAVDRYTVQFKMKKALGPFLIVLVRLYILSEDQVMANIKTPGPYGDFGDYGKEWLLGNSAGSGLYKIREFKRGSYLIMERNEDYWGTSASLSPDEVTHYFATEPATVRTMIGRRELEICDIDQPIESLNAMDQNEGVDIAYINAGGTMVYFMMHTKKPPTDDVHFRKALSYVFDYQVAVQSIFPGAPIAIGPVPSGLGGWNPNSYQYEQNLEKAQEELALSKYAENHTLYPVDLHFTAEAPFTEKLATLLSSNAAEIGITVNTAKTPWLSIVDEMANMDASPNIETIFVSAHYSEAGSILESRYHSNSAATWEQNEWLLDPIFDSMIGGALATINQTERHEKYYEIQDYIVDLCPSIFLFEFINRQAYQAGYIDWPAARGDVISVMGYEFDARSISVDNEKKALLEG